MAVLHRTRVAIGVFAAALLAPIVGGGQMATADRLEGPGWWPTKGLAPRGDYMGAAACSACHAVQSATQPATSMARTASRAERSDVLRAGTRLQFSSGSYTYEIVTTGQQSLYSVSDGTRRSSAPLAWAFGAGQVGQSFLFQSDGAFREARVSYYNTAHALDFTPARKIVAPRDVDEAMSRPVNDAEVRRCFACHTTASTTESRFDPSHATPGITCEACHGPGRRHVDLMKQRRPGQGTRHILNPATFEPVDSVDYCGACHATFWDVQLAGERGIAELRSQPYRLLSSRCWSGGDARITCIACHNPHVALVRDPLVYDARCRTCHVESGTGVTRERPGRACSVGDARCVTCHMPKYDVPEMHHEFTDHLIRIVRKQAGEQGAP
jgi:hypothetical protein